MRALMGRRLGSATHIPPASPRAPLLRLPHPRNSPTPLLCRLTLCCCFPQFSPCGIPVYGQQCCHASGSLPSGEFGVFYDFGSLHQKDANGERTEAERAAFSAALGSMGAWYAHALTTTMALNELPSGWAGATRYSDRGWTTFESTVSQLSKESGGGTWTRFARATDRVFTLPGDVTARKVPAHPEDFAARLARKTFTNGKSDCELVAGLYADSLDGAFGNTELLLFKRPNWGDEEAALFAKVLPLARRARVLSLAGADRKEIGAAGVQALADAVAAGAAPQLKEVEVWLAPGVTGAPLREACEARGIKATIVTLPGAAQQEEEE